MKRAFFIAIGLLAVAAVVGTSVMMLAGKRRSRADDLFEQGKYAEAAPLYEELLDEAGGPFERFTIGVPLATCWQELGQHSEAVVVLGEAIDGLDQMMEAGQCPLQPAKAVDMLADLHFRRAVSYHALGERELALADVRDSEQTRADFRREVEEFERFEANLERAIREAPPGEVEEAVRRVPGPE